MARGLIALFFRTPGQAGLALVAFLFSGACSFGVHAQELSGPAPIWAPGQLAGFSDARLRFETVDAGGRGEASAMTLRLRAGVEATLNERAAALFEIEGVADISSEDSRGGVGRRLIPDRPVLELNRAQISYALPSVRFVGG